MPYFYCSLSYGTMYRLESCTEEALCTNNNNTKNERNHLGSVMNVRIMNSSWFYYRMRTAIFGYSRLLSFRQINVSVMTRIIPNKPFIAATAILLLWVVASLFIVIPVHVSTILISVCLVYIGSYISIFTKKVQGGWFCDL